MRFFHRFFGCLFAVIVFLASVFPVFAATSVTTTASQVITSGSLTISVPGSFSLPNKSVSLSSQTSTGTLSPVNVNDGRGTGAGWTASVTMQHLTVIRDPLFNITNTSPLITLSSGVRYDGTCGVTSPNTSYKVTIANGGAVGTATYTVTDGCGDTNQTNATTAATNNNVGTRGVKVDFPAGTYVAGDFWVIPVDIYPFTGITITPQAPSAAAAGSDLTGVTQSSAGAFSGTGTVSSSKTILTAGSDQGMGSYNQNVVFDVTIHENSYAGSFSGTLTATVS